MFSGTLTGYATDARRAVLCTLQQACPGVVFASGECLGAWCCVPDARGGRSVEIVIPRLPLSLNRYLRLHHHARHKVNNEWADIIKVLSPGKPQYKRARVTITYYFPDKRRRDPDNYGGKCLLDALTRAGIIEDDSFAHVEVTVKGASDKENPRTVINIEEVEV